MLFRDRSDAGRQLAQALSLYKKEDCVILALPRGGVPVAKEVAKLLRAPLELVFVRKIGAPHQPELAVGAIVDGSGPIIVRNESVIRALGVRETEFGIICKRELDEIGRRRSYYLQGHTPVSPAGRVAIVIDDGIATGATTRAALQATRRRAPRKLVLAVPVASRDAIESLSEDADEIVCLATPEPFDSVGRFYDNFEQLTHQQVRILLAEAAEASADSQA
jgi:predicted phosphoribosyltransferase